MRFNLTHLIMRIKNIFLILAALPLMFAACHPNEIPQEVEKVVRFEAKEMVGDYYGTMYSDKYNICLYLTDLGFSEDGKAKAGATYYMLDLYTSTEPTLDENGYMNLVPGTYKLDFTGSPKDMTIDYTNSWYFKINANGTGYAAETHFYTAELVVSDKDVTLTATVNGNKVVATYNDTKFRANILTTFEDTEIEATSLFGEYFGIGDNYVYNYNIYLSDKGLDDDGHALADAYYFSLDLYGRKPEIDDEGYLHIPNGTYYYDFNNYLAKYEIGSEYSGAYKTNADATAYEGEEVFSDVTVLVDDDGIKVEAVIAGGKFKITYSDEPKFYVGTELR